MTVHLLSLHARGAAPARRLRASARRYLAALGLAERELSVTLVTDRRIRRLNRDWRGKDAVTDVLSFPLSEPPGNGPLLGDVVISLDTAVRRARAEGRPVGAELDRYLAHGLLHLVGYDHERPADARRMADKESWLVAGEGLVGAALAGERWTRSQTSTSTPSRSGSTARGTRARTSRAASRR